MDKVNDFNFRLVSKPSIIGLLIKLGLFALFLFVFASSLILKLMLFLIIFLVLLYNFFIENTIVYIKNNTLTIYYSKGVPMRNLQYSFLIDEIENIDLIQTHDLLYGRKYIIVNTKKNNNEKIRVILRYYQLVQLIRFLQEEIKIKSRLVG